MKIGGIRTDFIKHGVSKVPFPKRRDDHDGRLVGAFGTTAYLDRGRCDGSCRHAHGNSHQPQFLAGFHGQVRMYCHDFIDQIQIDHIRDQALAYEPTNDDAIV